MKSFLKKFEDLCIKESKIIVILFLLIIVFAIVNIIINRINIRNDELITENLSTLTNISKELISKIQDEEEIKVYLFDYGADDYVSTFAKKYEQLNKNIIVEIKKAKEDEELASSYGIKEGEYDILIISGENSRLIKEDDLYSYDYNTGNVIDLTEQRLTNGIVQVTSVGERIPLYILKGHEKYVLENELSIIKRYVELENYELKELDLSSDDIPEDCNIIMINTMNSDFLDEETDKIKDYINNGGNILWLEDAKIEEIEYSNVKSVLEMFGVEDIKAGVVFEQDNENIILQNPYLILPKINDIEVLGDFDTQGKVMFYYSTRLNFVEDERLKELNVKKIDLLSTSDKALLKTDFSNDVMSKKEGDEEGKFIVGALLEKSLEEGKKSKLMIYANNYFITNNVIKIGKEDISVVDLYNNRELINNSINYLSENQNNLEITKLVPRNYYIGIENNSVKQALIVEGIILIVFVRNHDIYKKKKK